MLDPALAGLGEIRVHLSDRPGACGAAAFASQGQVWIARESFLPRSLDGLRLIGHELAHLGQQSRMQLPGAAHILLDPELEAAADAFGEAFATAALLKAEWQEAAVEDAAPGGVIQCSYARPQQYQAAQDMAKQLAEDDFGDEDDEDDEDEDDEDEPEYTGGARDAFASPVTRPRSSGGPPPPYTGARDAASSFTGTAKGVIRPVRAAGGMAVGAFNQVQGIAAGSGMVGSITGAAGSAVGAALAPAAMVTGPVGLALMALDVALSAKSAASTYSHMKKLEAIIVGFNGKKGVMDGTMAAIGYTLNKKNKKLKRKGIGCIPVLGSICNTVYTIGRTIKKKVQGTKGVDRRRWALVLWENQMAGDPAAIAACQELLGQSIYTSIRAYHDGHLVLKKKMKSM